MRIIIKQTGEETEMRLLLTEMHSIRDALRTMYMSKRTWNWELEEQLKEMVDHCTDRYGRPLDLPEDDELKQKFDKDVAKLLKWGTEAYHNAEIRRYFSCCRRIT